MTKLHVLLSMAQEPEKLRCVLHDLTEKQFKNQFLKPYYNGRSLLCGREIYPVVDIRRVFVIATEDTAGQALFTVNQRLSKSWRERKYRSTKLAFVGPSFAFGLSDLGKVGKDVTEQFFKESSGHFPENCLVLSLLKNQWVIGIGTAVIATCFTAWLKLS